jgi:hypothetical protein
MRKFAIYYNNGDVVYGGGDDDEEVTLTFSKKWLEAPSDGVSCVTVENSNTGRSKLFEHEYYYQLPINHHGDGDVGCSMKLGAFIRQLADQGGIVKCGGWTAAPNHNEQMKKATLDPYIKQGSGTVQVSDEDGRED